MRTLTGEQREQRLPPGTLREWHWRALAKAYEALPHGLEPDAAGNYGGIDWQVWLRLRDDQVGALVEEASFFRQVERSDVSPARYYIKMTPFGKAYYRREWEHYRALHPEVDAPEPVTPDTEDTP